MAEQTSAEGAEGEPQRRVSHAVAENWENLDEYGRLVRYASTYREPGIKTEEREEVKERRVWYAPWKKRRVRVKTDLDESQLPADWLITNINHGLSGAEVNHRRTRTGWNELVAEKENPVAKFLSYFRGPILYGKINRPSLSLFLEQLPLLT